MPDEINIKTKSSKTKLFILIAAIAIVVLTIGAVILFTSKGGTAKKVEKQLSLGAKYLSELDYEQAVAAYELAIEIDPKSVDAYLGVAEVYIVMGEYDKAEEVLEDAKDAVDGEDLRKIEEKLEEVKRKKGETEQPVATPTPMPTSTPEPTATPVPQVDLKRLPVVSGPGDVQFDFNDMTYNTSYWAEYRVNGEGAITVQYDQLYGEVKLTLPQAVDMSKCSGITVKMETGADLGVKLYDAEFNEVYAGYTEETQGVAERYFLTDLDTKVTGIGLLSCEEELTDYSEVKATVYSITFHLDYQEFFGDGMVRYDFNDLKYYYSYGTDYNVGTDGAISLHYDALYSEILFFLPQMLDIDESTEIGVKLQSGVGNLAIKLYDTEFKEIYASYDGMTFGTEEKRFTPGKRVKIAGIGLMAGDNSLVDYSLFDATVYSITFYLD